MKHIGIDPGAKGAIAVLGGESAEIVEFSKTTPHEWSGFLLRHAPGAFCYLERVSAMPGQGVASTFKFGHQAGMLEGILVAHFIPFERVTPQTWQRGMGCLSGGNKNVTKRRAEELFPDQKITHSVADALLIAEWCRRNRR